MKAKLSQLDAQLARTEKLLRIADPDGWLKPGTQAAAVSHVHACPSNVAAVSVGAASLAPRRRR